MLLKINYCLTESVGTYKGVEVRFENICIDTLRKAKIRNFKRL